MLLLVSGAEPFLHRQMHPMANGHIRQIRKDWQWRECPEEERHDKARGQFNEWQEKRKEVLLCDCDVNE